MRKSTLEQINIKWTKASGSIVTGRTPQNQLCEYRYTF